MSYGFYLGLAAMLALAVVTTPAATAEGERPATDELYQLVSDCSQGSEIRLPDGNTISFLSVDYPDDYRYTCNLETGEALTVIS